MKMQVISAAIAVCAMITFASSAQAQLRSLQFDVNNATFGAFGETGAPLGLNTNFTGQLRLGFAAGSTRLEGIAIQDTGPGYVAQAFTSPLSNFNVIINLVNGVVTNGSLSLVVANGNSYTANVIGGGGQIRSFVGGGFYLDSLTSGGAFDAASFSGVPIADFFAGQNSPGGLPGSFLNFRLTSNPQGGNADVDIWVTNIPTPGTLAMVAGGGLMMMRRRRR